MAQPEPHGTAQSELPSHCFVIVGGGMTGIELAAEMRTRIAHHAGEAVAARAHIVLLEQAGVIGPELGANPRPVIERALAEARVETRLGCRVAAFDERGVVLADGSRIDAAAVVVTIGLRASALTLQIPGERDALGRLLVDGFQRVPGVPAVYATGDVARAVVDEHENVALMSCQHARTMGKYAGYNAAHDLLGLPPRAYRQPDYVTCLDLGRFGAVFTRGWNREVHTAGPDAKRRKIMINTERIYPPRGSKEAIFAGMRIDAGGR
jgi:NADH dehydrogenase